MNFIERAKQVHQDTYDYSKVKYINSTTKVEIICKEHGSFWQFPHNHLRGQGCSKCRTIDTTKFIEKAQAVHGIKYDYSLLQYKNSRTKIKIICKEHGIFEQFPLNHLNGQGCPSCIKLRHTTKQIIEKFRDVHRDTYDYSLAEYKGINEPITIVCKIHGAFEQTPHIHLKGSGCPKCGIIRLRELKLNTGHTLKLLQDKFPDYNFDNIDLTNRTKKQDFICNKHGSFVSYINSLLRTAKCPDCRKEERLEYMKSQTEQIISRFREIHQDKYNYSLVKYQGADTKVIILCRKHGQFEQTPSNHLNGQGCPICARNRTKEKESFSWKEIRERLELMYDYDYSKAQYSGIKSNITIVCKKHGAFSMSLNSHLYMKRGCPKCSGKIVTTESFIEKAQQVHKDLYSYNKTVYKCSQEKVEIICKVHGSFWQLPTKHLAGCGCPNCKTSKGEIQILNWLKEHNIEYEQQKSFKELGKLKYDFFIPNWNLLIEYNGKQHYQFIKHFHRDLHTFHYQKHRDWLKRKFAKDNDIQFLVIKYDQDISEVLANYVYEKNK